MMSKNNSSLIHFHIVVQCSQRCQNENQLALKFPSASCTRGKNQNLSNIACTIGAKEACAHIFQLLAHICFEMGTHSPPLLQLGMTNKDLSESSRQKVSRFAATRKLTQCSVRKVFEEQKDISSFLFPHCTMCILVSMFTFQSNKLRHILKDAS